MTFFTNAVQSPPTPTQADCIARALYALIEPGSVFELRALGVPDRFRTRVESSFWHYDDIPRASSEAVAMDQQEPRGIYFTLNPVDRQLLARSPRRWSTTSATTDRDVLRRRWLLIDCDPVRPADTSASDQQVRAAADHSEAVRDYLRAQGWQEPIVAASGNGRHLLYPIDLNNDSDTTAVIKQVLQRLAAQFDDDTVTIDTSVFNAGRICRLYGTTTRKGHDLPEFPHRRAEVLHAP